MPEPIPNISELYGKDEALFTYKMARSLDRGSNVADNPIGQLARDAVLTALRLDRDENGLDPLRINVEIATRALTEALEAEAMGSITTL